MSVPSFHRDASDRTKKNCSFGLDSEGCFGILDVDSENNEQNHARTENIICFSGADKGLAVTKCGKGKPVFRDDINELTASHCCMTD